MYSTGRLVDYYWETVSRSYWCCAVVMQVSASTCVDCATTRAWHSRTWTDTPSLRFTWWKLVMSASSAQKVSSHQWTWSNTVKTSIQHQTQPSFTYQSLRPMPKSSDVWPMFTGLTVTVYRTPVWKITEGMVSQWCNWSLITCSLCA